MGQVPYDIPGIWNFPWNLGVIQIFTSVNHSYLENLCFHRGWSMASDPSPDFHQEFGEFSQVASARLGLSFLTSAQAWKGNYGTLGKTIDVAWHSYECMSFRDFPWFSIVSSDCQFSFGHSVSISPSWDFCFHDFHDFPLLPGEPLAFRQRKHQRVLSKVGEEKTQCLGNTQTHPYHSWYLLSTSCSHRR